MEAVKILDVFLRKKYYRGQGAANTNLKCTLVQFISYDFKEKIQFINIKLKKPLQLRGKWQKLQEKSEIIQLIFSTKLCKIKTRRRIEEGTRG